MQKTRSKQAAHLSRNKSDGSLISDKENIHNYRNGRIVRPVQAKGVEAARSVKVPFKLKSSIHAFHNSGVNAKIQGRVLQMEHVDKEKENESPPVSR